jgi:hypothetical protein
MLKEAASSCKPSDPTAPAKAFGALEISTKAGRSVAFSSENRIRDWVP